MYSYATDPTGPWYPGTSDANTTALRAFNAVGARVIYLLSADGVEEVDLRYVARQIVTRHGIWFTRGGEA